MMRLADYFIKYMSLGHCARGPSRCEKCKEAEKDKKYYILKADYEESMSARPTVELIKDGKKTHVYYNVIKGFKTEKEAINHAREKGLNLIQ